MHRALMHRNEPGIADAWREQGVDLGDHRWIQCSAGKS